ncbi:MAG: T9SS type A sorting domain-containing protein [Flavobacteriales bacterium]
MPFSDNFSSALSGNWNTSASNAAGVVSTLNLSGNYPAFGTTTDASGTATGYYGLAAYNTSNLASNNNINADLALNLNNLTGISSSFSLVDWGSGYAADQMRVYVSNNGGSSFGSTYTTINLALSPYTDGIWNNLSVDISALFSSNSLTPSSTSVIRFTFILRGSGNTTSPKTGNQMIYLDNMKVNNTSTLPVQLTSFSGEKEGDFNLLQWSTSSEIENDYFELQKSYDGITYFTVYIVSGQGSTNSFTNYHFYDTEITNSTVYYKLKQVDFNGDYCYFNIISIAKEESEIKVFLKDKETIVIEGQGLQQMEIYNECGQLLQRNNLLEKESTQQQTLSSQLNSAIYFIRVKDHNNWLSKKIRAN